jgi:membrane-anchored protein YejM (alkaline phosphatase superfamily)
LKIHNLHIVYNIQIIHILVRWNPLKLGDKSHENNIILITMSAARKSRFRERLQDQHLSTMLVSSGYHSNIT